MSDMDGGIIEYMVERKATRRVALTKLGIMAAALLLAALAMALSGAGMLGPFGMLGSVIAVAACYGGWRLLKDQDIEYEYSVSGGEIEIDKIAAKRKRTRIVTVNCREVESFGRYKAADHLGREYEARILACDNPDSPNLWYAVARVKEKGLTLVVFNANSKMLDGIKPFLPRRIMYEVFMYDE